MKKTISVILAVLMIGMTALPCFAGENTCSAYGDVNSDTKLNVTDVRLILRDAIGLETFTETQTARADIDNSGTVTVDDARLALRVFLKKKGATLPDHPVTIVNPGVGNATDTDSEYNILASTQYVVSAQVPGNGTSTPMMIARDGSNVYIEINYSGIELGLMVKDGKTYMVSTDHKYSLELTDDIYNAMDDMSEAERGTMKKDMQSMSDPSSYSFPCPDLSTATKVETETVTCPVCGEKISTGKTVYTFGDDINRTEVYMNGKELLKTVEYAYGVQKEVIEFDYISATVPASYFALPSKSSNRYPTFLITGQTAVLTFLLKVIDLEELMNA